MKPESFTNIDHTALKSGKIIQIQTSISVKCSVHFIESFFNRAVSHDRDDCLCEERT